MAPNTITGANLTEGAPWTLVHTGGPRAGEHDFFTFEKERLPGGPGTDKQGGMPLTPLHSLLNVRTGGRAWVTEKWLREGMIGNGQHAYWLIGHVPAEMPVAA